VLIRLAGNWEVVPLLVDGLTGSIASILSASDHPENCNVERHVCTLLSQIVQVIYTTPIYTNYTEVLRSNT